MTYSRNQAFSKLLLFCTAAKQVEINAWIASNISNAGSEAISAPHSNDAGSTLTHYLGYWRLEGASKTSLTDHIDATYDAADVNWAWTLPSGIAAILAVPGLVPYETIE